MSLVEEFLNSKTFSKLLIKGKDQKFITPEEINDAIPVSIVSQAELDLIMINIKEARIDVIATDHAPHTREEKETICWCSSSVVL